jgi:hypothetical protein
LVVDAQAYVRSSKSATQPSARQCRVWVTPLEVRQLRALTSCSSRGTTVPSMSLLPARRPPRCRVWPTQACWVWVTSFLNADLDPISPRHHGAGFGLRSLEVTIGRRFWVTCFELRQIQALPSCITLASNSSSSGASVEDSLTEFPPPISLTGRVDDAYSPHDQSPKCGVWVTPPLALECRRDRVALHGRNAGFGLRYVTTWSKAQCWVWVTSLQMQPLRSLTSCGFRPFGTLHDPESAAISQPAQMQRFRTANQEGVGLANPGYESPSTPAPRWQCWAWVTLPQVFGYGSAGFGLRHCWVWITVPLVFGYRNAGFGLPKSPLSLVIVGFNSDLDSCIYLCSYTLVTHVLCDNQRVCTLLVEKRQWHSKRAARR